MKISRLFYLAFGLLVTSTTLAQPALYMGDTNSTANDLNCQGKIGSYCYVSMPDQNNPQSEGICYRVNVLSESESVITQVNAQFCNGK